MLKNKSVVQDTRPSGTEEKREMGTEAGKVTEVTKSESATIAYKQSGEGGEVFPESERERALIHGEVKSEGPRMQT